VEIQTLIEGLLVRIFREAKGVEIPTPFPRMTYAEAISRYGSDKPDLRFGMELLDVGDVFRDSQFKVFRSVLDGGGVLKAINAKGAAALLSKEQLKKWEEWVKTEFGAKGSLHQVERWWRMGVPIVKFFTDRRKPRSPRKWNSPKATSSSSVRINSSPPAKSSAACACVAPIFLA
jgi:aspartyl-tRNA synthetase